MHPCTATYLVAMDLASLPRWAPVLPRVPQRQSSPSCRGGLWRRHMLVVPDLAFLHRWALALPHVPQLQTSPPFRGGLRHCHVPHGSGLCLPEGELRCCHMSHSLQRVVDHKNKGRSSCPRHAARLTCFDGTLTHYWGIYKTCARWDHHNLEGVHTCRYSVAQQSSAARLTAHRHSWQGMWPDRTTRRWPCSV
jgi:hypothetical protein